MHKIKKKLVCIILTAIMILSNVTGAYAATEYKYSTSFKYTSLGEGVILDSGTYKYGFLNLNKGTWEVKKWGSTMDIFLFMVKVPGHQFGLLIRDKH